MGTYVYQHLTCAREDVSDLENRRKGRGPPRRCRLAQVVLSTILWAGREAFASVTRLLYVRSRTPHDAIHKHTISPGEAAQITYVVIGCQGTKQSVARDGRVSLRH